MVRSGPRPSLKDDNVTEDKESTYFYWGHNLRDKLYGSLSRDYKGCDGPVRRKEQTEEVIGETPRTFQEISVFGTE